MCEWLSAEGEERGAAAAASSGAAAARESAAASDAIEVHQVFPLLLLPHVAEPMWLRLLIPNGLSFNACRFLVSCRTAACQRFAPPALFSFTPDAAGSWQQLTACTPAEGAGPHGTSQMPYKLTACGRLWRRRCPRRWVTSWPRRPRMQRPAQATRLRRGSCCASRRAARCVAHAV